MRRIGSIAALVRLATAFGVAAGFPLSPIESKEGGPGAEDPPLLRRKGQDSDEPARADRRVVAKYLYTVADDFIVNIWHNGKLVGDDQRELLQEIFGATVEKTRLEVRAGDWLVFNVVNNRLRWGGAHYFAVAGMAAEGESTFASDDRSGRWSACDDASLVARFIHDSTFLADNPAKVVANPWPEGDSRLEALAAGWRGKPLWGETRNTWIKFRAP